MVLNNIKSKELNGGFTIVELLVVIVVIGILAGITVVSYTGITAKANKAAAIQNASSVMTVADAFFAENNGSYPTTAEIIAGTNTSVKLPSNIAVISTVPTSAAPASISYNRASATSYCIQYWDTAAATPVKATFATAGVGTCL